MLPAVPHSIPELGAPQFGHTLQQKHFFLLASPCLILAKLLYSFHFLSLENSLVLLMQCSNVALLQASAVMWHFSKLNLMESLLPTLHCLTAALRHSMAPWEAVVAVGAWTL